MTDEKFARVVAAALRVARLRTTTEAALQDSIQAALTVAKIPYEREKALTPKDRPDFLLADGRVVLEAKARYNRVAIYRQLDRYAAHASVTALILVTGTPLGLPEAINGKPIFVVPTGLGLL